MRGRSKFSLKASTYLGLAQLAIAAFGIGYALYPNPVKTETLDARRVLEDVWKNNSGETFNSQRIGDPPLRISQTDPPLILAAYHSSAPGLHQQESGTPRPVVRASPTPQTQQKKVPAKVINVTGKVVDDGTPLRFQAWLNPSFGCGNKLLYTWLVKGKTSRIVRGAGTKSITVDTSNLSASDPFPVWVNITSAACSAEGSVEAYVTPLTKNISGSVENLEPGERQRISVTIKGQAFEKSQPALTSSGTFMIPNVPNGTYRLLAFRDKKKIYERPLRVKAGQYIRLPPISLTQEPGRLPDLPIAKEQATPTPTSTPGIGKPNGDPKLKVVRACLLESPVEGTLSVKSPEKLQQNWTDTIRVIYTPSPSSSPGKDACVPFAAFRLNNLKGLKDLSRDRDDFKPLNSPQEWSMKIQTADNAVGAAEYTLQAEIKIPRKDEAEIKLEHPGFVQQAEIPLRNAFLSKTQVYGGSGIFVMTGLITLSLRRLPKKPFLVLSDTALDAPMVASKEATVSTPSSAETEAKREVNAWLVDSKLPLTVAKPHQLAVNIGAPRAASIVGGPFAEPEWGDFDQLDLVVLLEGPALHVSPSFHELVLPRTGESETKLFTITPKTGGSITLSLSIFLARELTLLEEFTIELPAKQNLELGVAAA